MNIDKISKIVQESALSEEIKDVILSLLPVAEGNEGVKSLILGLMDHEAQLADLDADEAGQLASEFKMAIEQLSAIEDSMSAEADVIIDKLKERVAQVAEAQNQVRTEQKLEDVRQQMTEVIATPQTPVAPAAVTMPDVPAATQVTPMSVTESSMPPKPAPVPTL